MVSRISLILLIVVFIYWFKISIDKSNIEAIKHNTEIKNHCPCERWNYVTKGHFECECPE